MQETRSRVSLSGNLCWKNERWKSGRRASFFKVCTSALLGIAAWRTWVGKRGMDVTHANDLCHCQYQDFLEHITHRLITSKKTDQKCSFSWVRRWSISPEAVQNKVLASKSFNFFPFSDWIFKAIWQHRSKNSPIFLKSWEVNGLYQGISHWVHMSQNLHVTNKTEKICTRVTWCFSCVSCVLLGASSGGHGWCSDTDTSWAQSRCIAMHRIAVQCDRSCFTSTRWKTQWKFRSNQQKSA